MEKLVQIQDITTEELLKAIRESLTPPPDPHNEILMNATIDRAFIKRNLRLSHRQLLRLEQTGVLRPTRLNPTEHSSVIYTMADYMKLLKHLKL